MSQSLKQIKNRIRSVENTKKVTGAMQMVAVAKLNRIEDMLFSLRPYALKLESMMYNLAALSQKSTSPYFKKISAPQSVALCLITSDSGLCGVYNQNVIRAAEDFLNKHNPGKIKLILVGQKGASYFRAKQFQIHKTYVDLSGRFSPAISDQLTAELQQLFLSGQVQAVHLAYTYFENSLVQKPVVQQLLSIEQKQVKARDYLLEPDLKGILDGLIPQYLQVKMRLILLEAFTAEHAARTVAMKTATDNAKELLEGLVLLRNKVRQAVITQDILEISSSVEALRG